MARVHIVMLTIDIAWKLPLLFRRLGQRFVAGEPAGTRQLDALFLQMRDPGVTKGGRTRRAILHSELKMLKDNLEDAAQGKVPRFLVSAHSGTEIPEYIRMAYEEEI